MAKAIKKHGKTALIFSLLILGIVVYMMTLPTKAGTTEEGSDTLSDSRPTTTADHLIYFLTPSGVDADGDTIIIDFDDSFKFTSLVVGDVDFATSTDTSNCSGASYSDVTLAAGDGADTWGWTTTTDREMVFDPETNAQTGTITAGTCIEIQIGTNAGGSNQMTNGWPGVKDIDIVGDFGDTGKMKVAIIEGVTVTATVAETLTAVVNASTCDSFTTNSDSNWQASATTSIAYGSVDAEEFYDSCQRIDIGTNAGNGYTATIHKTQPLTYSSYTIADGDCDGACSTTSAQVWQTNTNNGFGYCMKDRDLNGAQVADSDWGTYPCGEIAANQYFKVISNTSADAKAIMESGSATTTNRAWIGYRLSVDTVQTAGDYTATIIYVVTPKY